MMMQKPPSEYWTNLRRRFLVYAPAKLGLENPMAVVMSVENLGGEQRTSSITSQSRIEPSPDAVTS